MPEMSLVGRDDALAQVVALRTCAGDGSFAAVVVEGETGIGKLMRSQKGTAIDTASRRGLPSRRQRG